MIAIKIEVIIMHKKIIVGIDTSEHSKKALNKAIELTRRDNSDLFVFHSVLHKMSEIRPALIGTLDMGGAISYEIHQDTVKRANDLMKEVEEHLKKEQINAETKLVYDLGPQYYIEEQVKEKNIDLVVLGSKGEHNMFTRTFIGTIPEHVINHVNADVLVVK